jgi:hypothetical protein
LGLTKKLRIGFGFGETVSVEEPGSDALSLRALRFTNKPTLEPSERPALIDLCAGRITVDAREKD